MKMEPELETLYTGLEQMKIYLNTTRQGNHVLDTDCLIHTAKDSARATLAGTPFEILPTTLTVGILLAKMFWGNTIPDEDVVLRTMIPYAIVTVRQIFYEKHCRLNFCDYF